MTAPDYLPSGFEYVGGRLQFAHVDLASLANRFGTPLYVYDAQALTQAYDAYANALGSTGLVCFAVKANASLSLLSLLAKRGAGFDVVSGGELETVIKAGGSPAKCVFSGVAKSQKEIKRALQLKIKAINIESIPELRRVSAVASELGTVAPITFRINPNVSAKTHPKISTGLKINKFGIPHEEALKAFELAASLPNVCVVGIDCHIGSQITDLAPFAEAADCIIELARTLKTKGIPLSHIDFGGGLGVRYRDVDTPPAPAALVKMLQDKLNEAALSNLEIILEPGRSLVATSGVFLTRVEYVKETPEKRFALVDAGMNDMVRVAMYDADMPLLAIKASDARQTYDVAGPICESSDVFKKDILLPALTEGDYLAIAMAGAYGFSMASHYNMRAKVAEVLLEGGVARLIRKRQTLSALWDDEIYEP